jgi:hypothetical protein
LGRDLAPIDRSLPSRAGRRWEIAVFVVIIAIGITPIVIAVVETPIIAITRRCLPPIALSGVAAFRLIAIVRRIPPFLSMHGDACHQHSQSGQKD